MLSLFMSDFVYALWKEKLYLSYGKQKYKII